MTHFMHVNFNFLNQLYKKYIYWSRVGGRSYQIRGAAANGAAMSPPLQEVAARAGVPTQPALKGVAMTPP
jgi:hypothetical protein